MVEQNAKVGEPWEPNPKIKEAPPADPQGPDVTNFLKKQVQEDQFNAFCIDCQRNKSSHCNVTFGTFICGECAQKHAQIYPMFSSYIKPLFQESWDGFQLRMVAIGGNKRFFEFLREYGKERDAIEKKY